MSAEAIVSRLERVRRIRDGRWVASCPGPLHKRGDRNPSLQVDQKPDGTVLIVCRAGCDRESIRQAIGFEWHELYPPRQPTLQREQEGRPRDRPDVWTLLRELGPGWDAAALTLAVCARHPEQLTVERRRRIYRAAHMVRKSLRALGLVQKGK